MILRSLLFVPGDSDRKLAKAQLSRADALVFHPAAAARARVAFFTSCVMEVMFPRINRDAVRLLVLAGCEVRVPRSQTCCGALHAHAGLRRVAKDLARKNARTLALFGYGEQRGEIAGIDGDTSSECGYASVAGRADDFADARGLL